MQIYDLPLAPRTEKSVLTESFPCASVSLKYAMRGCSLPACLSLLQPRLQNLNAHVTLWQMHMRHCGKNPDADPIIMKSESLVHNQIYTTDK